MRHVRRGLLAVSLIALGRQLLMLARTMQSRRWLHSQDRSDPESGRVVLIPAYREEAVAAASAEHFQRISLSDRIVFVTSAVEQPPLTAQSLSGRGCDVWICPSADRRKATLLNYAAARVGPGRVLLLYDIDSRPQRLVSSPSSIRSIRQQMIFYQLPDGSPLPFWGLAARQTRWSLAYEAAAWRDDRFVYSVGHGFAAYSDLILDIGFDRHQPAEDIDFGYRSSRAGARFEVDSAVDVADAPATLTGFLEQNGRWFLGEVVALRAQTSRRLDVAVSRRIAGVAHWLLRPVSVVAVAVAVATGERPVRMVGIAFAACEIANFTCVVGEYRRLGLRTPHTPGALMAAFVGYLAHPVLAGVSAWRALLRYGPSARRNGGPQKAEHCPVPE